MVEILFKKDVVDAYPDGWSCVSCSTNFDEETINVECLYVIQTENEVLCLKCFDNEEEKRIEENLFYQELFRANDTPNHLKKKQNSTAPDISKSGINELKSYQEKLIKKQEALGELCEDIDKEINSRNK